MQFDAQMKSSAKRSVALARQLCGAARGHGRDPYAAGSNGLVIYGPPTSRVCKVRWAAAEAQQSFETVPDMFPERRSPWYLELNPNHGTRAVKLFAMSELGTQRPVVAFVRQPGPRSVAFVFR